MPGLGRGPPGRGGMPGEAGRDAGPGRGAAALPPPTPNGLLPTRGAAGRGAAGRAAPVSVSTADASTTDALATDALAAPSGTSETGASRRAAAAGTVSGAGTGGAAGCGGTRVVGTVPDSTTSTTGSFGFGAALRAGAFLTGAAGIASRSLRATGASTVEEGLLTYSPSSLSFARTTLLVTPSSFASSCTRALPGTALLFEWARRRCRVTR